MRDNNEWWWIEYAGQIQPAQVDLDQDRNHSDVWLVGSETSVKAAAVRLIVRIFEPS